MTAWLFSGCLALLATPPGSRGVTSPETTNIQEAPYRFVFCGHDGRGLAMTPTRTLFCLLQDIFQISASTATSVYTCGDRSDIVGVYQLRPDYTVDQMTALLYSRDLALLATLPGSHGVTSPETTNIQEAPHRFVFCGHDGRGLAMTPTRTLFCVLQGIFQIVASTATSGYTCGDRSDIVGVYQLRPDYTVVHMTAWLFSGDLALLATPPGSRGVTSPKNTTIKQSPHRFVFWGHDGRGLAMTPTRTFSAFCREFSSSVLLQQRVPTHDSMVIFWRPGSSSDTTWKSRCDVTCEHHYKTSTSPVRILWARWTRTGNDAYEDLVLRSAGQFPDRRISSNEHLHVRG
ncbi:hypothetical protein V5799_012501 [Amblyomma americanum]|uniref:Secreted protein n=1 Tax=Amblyomma americanum TaxID=6943 RepID=A0AAQ4EEJ8_AMBAM